MLAQPLLYIFRPCSYIGVFDCEYVCVCSSICRHYTSVLTYIHTYIHSIGSNGAAREPGEEEEDEEGGMVQKTGTNAYIHTYILVCMFLLLLLFRHGQRERPANDTFMYPILLSSSRSMLRVALAGRERGERGRDASCRKSRSQPPATLITTCPFVYLAIFILFYFFFTGA